jgi:predicted dehydrogenase
MTRAKPAGDWAPGGVVRWGIIGCGKVTEVKSGPGFQKADGSELVAVMRRNAALARDYAERHGVPRSYDDADALIADPEVTAVYVATPPGSHLEYTLKAAEAGKPVYVEKPMAASGDEAQRMMEACEAAGVPLFVAYYRRALPRFLGIKKLVDDRRIGTVRSVTTELWQPPRPEGTDGWRVDPKVAGGGYFADLAVHTLDFLDYVLGPVVEIEGFAQNLAALYTAEDTVSASFRYESGVLGCGLWCFAAGTHRDVTEIVGSTGSLRFSSFDTEPIEIETANGVERIKIENPEHVQQPLIQQVVDELRGKGSCPSTGRSALRTSRVMDEILSGYYQQAP